jgi:hypothetical protein
MKKLKNLILYTFIASDFKVFFLLSTPFIHSVVEEDEMGRTCNMHRIDEKCIQYFGWKI